MTVRQRWWLDAAVVLTGLAIGLLLTARHSPIAWIGPGLLFGAIVGIATHRLVPSAVIMVLAYERNWISVWHELRIIPIFISGIIIGESVLLIARALGITEILHLWR